MDSMRHLSTSLPSATNRRRRDEHSQELLSSFKAAALQVTNLYKTAAVDSTRAREAGYQDALDDLLAFLDRENLGLMDGEGWRVRQWATERLVEPAQKQHGGSDDEEDVVKEEPIREEPVSHTRSSSPEIQRKAEIHTTSTDVADSTTQRPVSEPPQQQAVTPSLPTPTTQIAGVPSLDDFSFRSTQSMPSNHDRESNHSMDVDSNSASGTNTVRITPKRTVRHMNHARSRESRNTTGTTLNFNLAGGAGGKRKIPYPDFFDISGLNFDGHDRKDQGGRGGKRGRFV